MKARSTPRSKSMPPPIGELLAWNPVTQRAAWHARYPVAVGGGVLATAGNLVFQGRADGVLAAYRATDGKQVWTLRCRHRDHGAAGDLPGRWRAICVRPGGMGRARWLGQRSRLGTGEAGLWADPHFQAGRQCRVQGAGLRPQRARRPCLPSPSIPRPQVVHQGELLFADNCAGCHGSNAVAGPLPDLRYASTQTLEGIEDIVLGGSARVAAACRPSRKS